MNNDILNALSRRILVIDGAMGTQLQARELTAADFGGPDYEGCNEHLVLTRPDVIEEVHRDYLAAGADIIETDSFGATSIVLAEYGLEAKVHEINRRAAEIARTACDSFATPERPRWVAGSMGPTTRTISVTGGVTFDQLAQAFREQALGLLAGGVDLLLLETAQDTLNLKAAAEGIRLAFDEAGQRVPLMISGTIEATGTMLAGQGVEALYASVAHLEDSLGLISIGLNCATGPEFMTDHLRTLSAAAACCVSVYPNAGLPDENGCYAESPESLAAKLARFVEQGWINIVGGCCGTTPAHIAAIAALVAGRPPRRRPGSHRRVVSGIEPLFVEDENRPILVGERTNVIGSRKFKNLIIDGKFEEAGEIARAQVRSGAQVIDVCVANPDRDEAADMEQLLEFLPRKVRVPFMIDSTDAAVMELALTRLQGKCLLNSVNLEDGEERFARVAPLVRRFGGALVVGCIDEDRQQGMAVTRSRKLEIARRSFDLLTGRYGLRPEDLVFDPLVFPVGSGDENYIGSAVETIEGVRLIAEAFPRSATILGISNVSFGLPAAGREVLNAVFLHHCVKAGLSYAIVNAEKLERYASLAEEERHLAEDLIFWRGSDPVAAFAAAFRDKKPVSHAPAAELPLDERLPLYIIEGSKEGLTADLDAALARGDRPLDIINGQLMAGMAEVGRLFNDNQLIVAEVLQSAEAMKAAVAHLEPHLEKSETATKGTLLLATVKGDVHDIGKNLVEIILSNNGFKVVNLGIKVPPEELIAAARREHPDFIGLSGLLVKSAQQMTVTAADLRAAGVDAPLLVGGAALSRAFSDTRIAPEYGGPVLYAKDAMDGLAIANQLADPAQRTGLLHDLAERQEKARGAASTRAANRQPADSSGGRSAVRPDAPIPAAPDYEPHLLRDIPLAEVVPYLNRQMLYTKHLGLSGVVERLLTEGDDKALKLHRAVEDLLARAEGEGWIRPQALYRYFPANGAGSELILFAPDGSDQEALRFDFPRQAAGERLCLADFARPFEGGERDNVALFVVTCGLGVRERAETLKHQGEFLQSHLLQALALELAEATAEYLHRRIRTGWGIVDDPSLTMKQIFNAEYRGIRVSFGYPACPELADQEKLFGLLKPERIGVQLTEGDMMDPEASVSALVFHHPEGRYFSVAG
ncbi:methionine synthase [Geobacter sp. SVR]|uniref:methionine synthase n=1 Tax=Geobacter sp. SVR TaxID=2495594 RepID=UPI00143EFCC7|nr:methionine synthase [Geobacter sp. SVR]BCS51746.1 methionine synthase [Geobacter sp. SVR]GCF84933.1 methionine synthase [Geobacter sp. SVR]